MSVCGSVICQTHYGTEDVSIFREGRDKEFRTKEESPLLEYDFREFKGLSYFAFDEHFKVKAEFQKTPSEKYFLMPTSSGKSVKYIKTGELKFEIYGEAMQLNAYQSEKILTNEEWQKKYGHAFFIPFRDISNGNTTYKGGRYIYMKIPDSTDTIVDFNLAFNPSCAYGSERYSCPIPPRANNLKVSIDAGEKIFVYTKTKKQ